MDRLQAKGYPTWPCHVQYHLLALYIVRMYNICMKKRMNIIVEDDDQKAMALIRRVYGLPSDTAAIRFALRKLMREEETDRVQREQRNRRSTQ